MPAFNYVSGNIANLTGGGAANMADLQGPLTDLRTTINGGLDETNVPNLAAAFTTYKRLQRVSGQIGSLAAGTYLLASTLVAPNTVANTANATIHSHLIHLDPTIYNANARTTKLRLTLAIVPNAVAPAITYTAGLYPVATYGGASGQGPIVATLSTVIAGSTAAIASPPAAAMTAAASADFNFPTSGGYVIAVATSGTAAVGEVAELVAQLEMRQV